MSLSPPNILILHCDQLRYDALGCTGHPGNPTPNIDELAAKGLAFTRHFTANPICMPSRASFFTGMPVTAHGVWTNGVPLNRREYMPFGAWGDNPYKDGVPELPTMADLLAEGGYATGAFGKLHLTPTVPTPAGDYPESSDRWQSGEQDDWHGPYYGFEHVELTHAHAELPGAHYDAWLRREHPELHARGVANQQDAERPILELGDLHRSVLTRDTHPSTWIGRRALEWIEGQKEKPFFAFLGFPDPHHAFCPLDEDLAAFEGIDMLPPVDANGAMRPDMEECGQDVRHFTPEQHDLVRRYTAAMVRGIDIAIGEVIAGLKASGKWDNTVVLFTSDHGDYLGDHGRLRKSHFVSEQLNHVPCILRLPEGEKLEIPCLEAATSNVDILPTLLELAGVNVPKHVQGTSLLGGTAAHRFAYAHGFDGSPEGANFSIFDERFRYTVYPERNYAELFDHSTDLKECRNLAEDPLFKNDRDRLHGTLAKAQLRAVNPVSGRVASW